MVIQSEEKGCGKACVRNLLSLLYHDESFHRVYLMNDCTTFASIRTEMERFDVYYESYHVDSVKEIKKNFLPCIAQIIEEDTSHFVVIKKIKKKRILFLDSAFGEIDLSIQEFEKIFTHNCLLKSKYAKKSATLSTSLLSLKEEIFYAFCFVFESLIGCLFVVTTGIENGFIYMIISLSILAIFILLQNGFNLKLQDKLEKTVLLPFMKNSDCQNDFLYLSKIIQLQIGKRNKTISYGVLLIMLTFLLLFNTYHLAMLTLISLLFSLIRFPLLEKRGKINRDCSLKEFEFLKHVKVNYKESVNIFHEAKKIGKKYVFNIFLSWVLEIFVLLVLILFEMVVLNTINFNVLIYYLGLIITYSVSIQKLYETVFDEQKETTYINALSTPLSFFLLKNKLVLKYCDDEKGEFVFDEKESCLRISCSSRQKKSTKRYF